MSFNQYTPIMNLDSSKIKWKIRARAQALWKGVTRESKEFRGINIIFVDDTNARIHAFITAKLCQLFENELIEGQIYNIANFHVRNYTGDEFNRCLRSEKHIYFADFTKLEKDTSSGLKIQDFSFDLFDLLATEKMENDKRFLCDVIGVIDSELDMVEYMNDTNEEKIQLKFSITDGSCSRNVTFFDGFAQHVAKKLKDNCEKPVIVIIASAKVNKYAGELYLSNYPSTRFYINCNHYSVKQIREKALNPTFFKSKVTELEETEVSPKLTTMTIAEIKQMKESYIGQKIVCQVTFKKFEGDLQWYHSICLRCKIDLKLVDGRFQCPKATCGRTFPYPDKMYRICTLCSDSTGAIAVIFKDLEVRKITGKTVFEVTLDEAQKVEIGDMPPVIQALLGKEFTVTLKLNEDNVNSGSNVFEACDITLGFVNLASNEVHYNSNTTSSSESTKTSSASFETESEENFSETEIEDVETGPTPQTPPTKQSTNKSRARKSPQLNREVDDENVPLSKMKFIKKEKI
ncbi:hypothetical protein POM88_050561 [Heracleum sosnowskyi]|uniref:Replication protein A 70 kDa DNA-binding subunit B/D first OB fold domain-containing protein n=1 Tax=Heracleum sosnowskyi TaxID=360622 RepID=A0AAD8GXV8_9APIA|nr:hypothetical protein POM88_050561 [Heracleum sosnowskyi]